MIYTVSVLGQATAAVLCAALTTSAPSHGAAIPAPQTAARQAAELTHARQYTEAAEAYGRAFEETGDAVHLYSQAMSLRRAGSCAEAIGVFEAFIAERPPQSDVDAARVQVGECQTLIARSAPAPEPIPMPEARPPSPEPSEQDSATPRSQASWARDPLGGVLVAIGGVAAITGGGLLLASSGSANGPDNETERAHAQRETDVRNTSTAGVVVLSAGAALLVGGIVRYSIVARRGRSDRLSHGGLTWRF